MLIGVALSAAIDKRPAEKELVFSRHLEATAVGDLIVLDRGYADYAVMAFLHYHQREFVLRLPRHYLREVQPFWVSEAQDQVVALHVSREQRSFVATHGLASTLRVRLLKVEIEGGVIEVLATSLLDLKVYPRADLKVVYGWRWGVETYDDRLKNIFEVERFSGQSVLSIEQDF